MALLFSAIALSACLPAKNSCPASPWGEETPQTPVELNYVVAQGKATLISSVGDFRNDCNPRAGWCWLVKGPATIFVEERDDARPSTIYQVPAGREARVYDLEAPVTCVLKPLPH